MEKTEAAEASSRAPSTDVGRDPEMVGGGGGGEPPVLRKGPAEGAGSARKGKSCKGYLYFSSQLKSQSRNPICVGITRTLQQGRSSCLLSLYSVIRVVLWSVLSAGSFRCLYFWWHRICVELDAGGNVENGEKLLIFRDSFFRFDVCHCLFDLLVLSS